MAKAKYTGSTIKVPQIKFQFCHYVTLINNEISEDFNF